PSAAASASRRAVRAATACSRALPEAEAADERVVVAAEADIRGGLVELLRVAPAEHDVIRLDRGAEPFNGLHHGLTPFLLAESLEPTLSNIVLERRLAKRQMAQFQRLHEYVPPPR